MLIKLAVTIGAFFWALCAYAQVAVPVPARVINLPDLSTSGAEYLSLTEQMRIRFEILSAFEGLKSPPKGLQLVTDGILQRVASEFMGEVLNRLAPNNDTAQYLLANQSFGASAYVGGIIITHQGLWEQSNSLSAFAAVLAHEWVHINSQHISRLLAAQEPSQWLGLLAGLAGVAAISSNDQIGQALLYSGLALPTRQFLSFSREMEEEADREGMAIMHRSGFRPQGMVETMEALSRYRSVGGNSLSFLQTHPLPDERLNAARRRAFNIEQLSAKTFSKLPSSARPLSTLAFEYDWLRFVLTAPKLRSTQVFGLKTRYQNRKWSEWVINILQSPSSTANKLSTENAYKAILADEQMTPIMLATFSKLFEPKVANPSPAELLRYQNFHNQARLRFPNSSILAELAATWEWTNADKLTSSKQKAIAQKWINEYLAHPKWQKAIIQPSAWNRLMLSMFQTNKQPLGEAYFLARYSLIRGQLSLAMANIELAEKTIAQSQSTKDISTITLLKSIPNLFYELQSLKSLIAVLRDKH